LELTVFIDPPLTLRGASRTDDPNASVVTGIGVNHQQQDDPGSQAKGVPTLFTALEPVETHKRQRVGPNKGGIVKVNAVLLQICSGLRHILFENWHGHSNVFTNM
jgi:hypothetical protein